MSSHSYNYPSFSSSLLEEIYRSFDYNDDYDNGGCGGGGGGSSQRYRRNSDNCYAYAAYANTLNKRMKAKSCSSSYNYMERNNLQYGDHRNVDKYVLDQWMEKEKLNLRRHSMPDDGSKFRRPVLSSSSTSSSDSSSGLGGFSSSDTDSLYQKTKGRSKIPSLKPIRTASSPEHRRKSHSDEKKKKEGKLKLQQRALKLYGDLKKVKQPISPGGKLASFLNSLFHSGSASSKKPKFETASLSSEKLSASTPSTASSYTRSCLSKTPSSAGRSERRSVKFCPVNIILDEAGQKSTDNKDVLRTEVQISRTLPNDKEFKVHVMEKQRKVEEVAKDLLKNYHSNNNQYGKELRVNVVGDTNSGVRKFVNNKNNINSCSFEDEDEDVESCCSADLFELDNLMEIGMDDRYREELPVYETTHVATNLAIANGYIL